MPTILRDLITTPQLNQDMVAIDMEKTISMLENPPSILYSIDRLYSGSEPLSTHKFEWFEDDYIPSTTAVATTVGNNSGTSLVVDDASIFVPNDTFVVGGFGGERLLVTAVNTGTNTLTVVRGYGSTSAASILEDTTIIKVGDVNPLGGDLLVGLSTVPVTKYNYAQIFKETVSVDRSSESSRMYSGGTPMYEQEIRGLEHMMQKIDNAFIFGQLKSDDANFTKRAYSAAGIDSFISTNRYDVSGAISQTAFEAWAFDTALQYGSENKICVLGSILSKAVASWYKTDLQLNPEYQKLGVKVMSYVTPDGRTLNFLHHKYFQRVNELKGVALVIDPVNVKKMVKRGMTYEAKPTTADKYIGEYLAEMSFKIKHEKTHALMTGVTSFS